MLSKGRLDDSNHSGKSSGVSAPDRTPATDNNTLIDYYTKLWPYHWIEKILSKAPRLITSRIQSLYSFKNRLLLATLFVVSGALVVIGILLQLLVFPRVSLDSRIIQDIKVIHFVSSVVVIILGWLFIDRLCKLITSPLRELTKKADEVSREKSIENILAFEGTSSAKIDSFRDEPERFSLASHDEIYRLTTSFNRMLTLLRATEARIRDSESRYRFLFDHVPSPVFVIDDRSLGILDINARAVEEYQYSGDELRTMKFSDLAVENDRDQTRGVLHKLIYSEEEFPPVIQHQRKDGSIFTVNFQATQGMYQGRPAIIAAVWDATEKLEKQARLIHSSKMSTLGEMATGIAHELNQPLYIIRLGCDYLSKKIKSGKPVSGEDLDKVLKELTTSVDRSTRIINHLREFGRKSDDSMTPTDINQVIQNAVSLMGKQLESKSILCELHLDSSIPRISANPNRLEQVFLNLLVNSRDAILSKDDLSQHGALDADAELIRIQSACDSKNVVIEFIDSGPGIVDQVKSKIFEPFFTTKKTGEGTGLGLAISYQIVRDHKGSIEVSNVETGGARFKLTFPVLNSGDWA